MLEVVEVGIMCRFNFWTFYFYMQMKSFLTLKLKRRKGTEHYLSFSKWNVRFIQNLL